MTWQSFPEHLIKLWDGSEIRVLVLLSLFVQIILIIFGSQRKYIRSFWINSLVWLAYLGADMVATVALGCLARSGRDFEANKSLKIQSFWAPFLLLHLGGPDTITAYSLNDNELWLRHLLNFLFQVGVAFYVFIPSWKDKDALRFIAIPVFSVGIIKYIERILVLYSSSSKQFKDSLRSSPDFSQDPLGSIENLTVPSKLEDGKKGFDEKKSADPSNVEEKEEGFDEKKSGGPSKVEDGKEWSDEKKSASPSNLEDGKQGSDEKKSVGASNLEDRKGGSDEKKSPDPSNIEERKQGNEKKSTDNCLIEAISLFKKFRCLYADLILDHSERKESYSLLEKKSAKEAFKLVTIELGFMYDVLYTKTITIYSKLGIILRCIWLFSHIFVSIFFLIIIDKSNYSPSDISITCVLLFGAIFLELYAFIVLLFSDWTKHWLTKHNFSCIDKCGTGLLSNDSRRWSGYMGQYNLLKVSFYDYKFATNELVISMKRLGIKEAVCKYIYMSWEKVDDGLLEKIFGQLLEKGREIDEDPSNNQRLKELLGGRGDYVLRKGNCSNKFRGSTSEVEFDYSLLLWHIATDLCYYDDLRALKKDGKVPPEWKIGKGLSDYMLYLLIKCPTMLPKGIGEIRYRDTCLDAMRFFRNRQFDSSTAMETACKAFVEDFGENNHHCTLSVLLHGCELAKNLQSYNTDGSRTCKWDIISEVWIEMLGYAASHCGWKEHGEHLARGGELLTHVCLLMAHLGLSDQYQLQQQPISPRWTTKLFLALQEVARLIIIFIIAVIIAIPEIIVLLVLMIITRSPEKACMVIDSWFAKRISSSRPHRTNAS